MTLRTLSNGSVESIVICTVETSQKWTPPPNDLDAKPEGWGSAAPLGSMVFFATPTLRRPTCVFARLDTEHHAVAVDQRGLPQRGKRGSWRTGV
jgi:hypothetical protein